MKAVFGHDQSSLNELIQPVFSFPFQLQWVKDEDVLLLPAFPDAQPASHVESALRSAKLTLQGITDVRARQIVGCHVLSDDSIVWQETVQPASIWAQPRQTAPRAAPTTQRAEAPQNRWTTLGHVRGNISAGASPGPALATNDVGPVADDWEQDTSTAS